MQTLKIDLVSDVVCPWCPIGYARFQRAAKALEGELAFEIEWHPFVLNPDVPPEGRPILEHLAHKYGRSAEQVEASQQQIVSAAGELDLDFGQALDRRSWNTFDVHRVLAWARAQGQQTAFNLALFDAYFGAARNPTDPALLRETATALGLDADSVDAILESDHYAEQVEQELTHYRQLGVSSVPSFVVEGQYLIAGAQDPATFENALRQIAERDSAPA